MGRCQGACGKRRDGIDLRHSIWGLGIRRSVQVATGQNHQWTKLPSRIPLHLHPHQRILELGCMALFSTVVFVVRKCEGTQSRFESGELLVALVGDAIRPLGLAGPLGIFRMLGLSGRSTSLANEDGSTMELSAWHHITTNTGYEVSAPRPLSVWPTDILNCHEPVEGSTLAGRPAPCF
jgi:hypothetical protein